MEENYLTVDDIKLLIPHQANQRITEAVQERLGFPAEKVASNIDIYGYLVTVKNTNTHRGDRMHFATLVDQYGEVFDTVLFPPVAAKYYFRGRGIYRFYGKVVSEFGFLSIEVEKMQKQDYIPDPRYSDMKTANKPDVKKAKRMSRKAPNS